MDELLFPLAAVGLTFFVLIPALTLVSRAMLAHKRRRIGDWAEFGTESTFAWLVMPTVVPTLWLTSSALHQSEPSQALESCLVSHVEPTACSDAMLLLLVLVVGIGATVALRAFRERRQGPLLRLAETDPIAVRVAELVATTSRLRGLRVFVARSAPAPMFTFGWIRAQTVLDACFARDADDDMLRAALLHEYAHAAGYDTFRAFLVRVCLSLNPARRLLEPDFARWQGAREAHCDSQAVHLGGNPLALAEGIVRASRFQCRGLGICGASLLSGPALALKLRLALLLAGPPRPARSFGHLLLIAAVVAVVVAPHVSDAGVLEHFHFEVERLLQSFV